MLKRLLIAALAPALLVADGSLVRSGPFEVISLAGDDAARETMNQLEQFRNAFGSALGNPDITPVQTVRVVVVKRNEMPVEPFLGAGREGVLGLLVEKQGVPPDWWKSLGLMLLEGGTKAPLPNDIEAGLIELFSTLHIDGTLVDLGAPPAAGQRNLDWAEVHLLATRPDYAGKFRVLLGNLKSGVPLDAALWNSFQMKPDEWRRNAQAYLAAGKFETTRVSAKPIDAHRDFYVRPVDRDAEELLKADVLLAGGARPQQAQEAYQAILNQDQKSAAAHEGLGLVYLKMGNKQAALRELGQARELGSKDPRAAIEFSRLTPDTSKALAALEAAAAGQPKYGPIYFELARRAPTDSAKAQYLEKATELAPRRVDYWEALAKALMNSGDAAGATKAWTAALTASASQDERARIEMERNAAEDERLDQLAEEERRKRDEKQAEIDRLKKQMEDRINAAEQQVRDDAAKRGGVKGQVLPWWEGPGPVRASGKLAQVVCQKKQAVLLVETIDGRLLRLLVENLGAFTIVGDGPKKLTCGVQQPKPSISVEYLDKQDGDTDTQGVAKLLQY